MAEDKNIKNWSAADIEKYWTGKLSATEMHALEKAAMDDPFLADALEGYKNSSSVADEMNSLHKKLETRIGNSGKIVPLGNRKFPWLRVAAAVIIIGGVGVLAQQLLLKKENNDIVRSADKKAAPAAERIQSVKSDSIPENKIISNDGVATSKTIEQSGNASGNTQQLDLLNKDTLRETENLATKEFKNLETEKKASEIAPPVAKAEVKTDDTKQKEEIIKKEAEAKALFDNKENASVAAKSKKDSESLIQSKNNAYKLNNRYNYRVVDEQNNPVPFANVTNIRDNVGTYTDIKGNFNLVSSDSLLDVQVRSLGYTADNFRLLPGNTNAPLTLKEDDRKQILVENNRRVSNNVSRKDSTTLEEPEVGWGYYNTYVSNNIKIPDNIRSKNNTSDVELSFDIDKTGNPVNIKVTRSSGCKECDEEAKRLLKEGPKWKHKGKKSKGSVVINVDQ